MPDKSRPVRIDAIDVESMELHGETPSVTFTVRCGKGTYIRSIARDLGAALGVGGHLTALSRLRVGLFDLSCAVPPEPEALAAARRFSEAEALAHLPRAQVPEPLARRLRQGQASALAELPVQDALFTVLDPAGGLVAIVEKEAPSGRFRIARGF
jgi:tRNA pseudouridine55 synthase